MSALDRELQDPEKYRIQNNLAEQVEIFTITDPNHYFKASIMRPSPGTESESVWGDGEKVLFRITARSLSDRSLFGQLINGDVFSARKFICEVSNNRLCFIAYDEDKKSVFIHDNKQYAGYELLNSMLGFQSRFPTRKSA